MPLDTVFSYSSGVAYLEGPQDKSDEQIRLRDQAVQMNPEKAE